MRCLCEDFGENWPRFNGTVMHTSWASYQIRKIAGCGNAGNVFTIPGGCDPDMHHGTCVTHVPWCMPGSLTSGFLWSRWRGNVPGIPSACATRNFTYLARGPRCIAHQLLSSLGFTICYHWHIHIPVAIAEDLDISFQESPSHPSQIQHLRFYSNHTH